MGLQRAGGSGDGRCCRDAGALETQRPPDASDRLTTRISRRPTNGRGARTACSRCGCPTSTRSAATRSPRGSSSSGWPPGRSSVAMLFGIAVLYCSTLLSGRAGQRTGVPFPVIGAHLVRRRRRDLPALVRAIIAIAWYGIQTYLARSRCRCSRSAIWPGLESLTDSKILGSLAVRLDLLPDAPASLQALIMRRGMETIRKFASTGPARSSTWRCSPSPVWILVKADLDFSLNFSSKELSTGDAWLQFFTVAALVVSYFSDAAAQLLRLQRASRPTTPPYARARCSACRSTGDLRRRHADRDRGLRCRVRRGDPRPGRDRRPDRQHVRR